MLKVYAATWCPHCRKTIDYLKSRGFAFEVIDIEKQAGEVLKKVIEVNGGEDWVVPTLEYQGKWRPGKVFKQDELERDLEKLGVPLPA